MSAVVTFVQRQFPARTLSNPRPISSGNPPLPSSGKARPGTGANPSRSCTVGRDRTTAGDLVLLHDQAPAPDLGGSDNVNVLNVTSPSDGFRGDKLTPSFLAVKLSWTPGLRGSAGVFLAAARSLVVLSR